MVRWAPLIRDQENIAGYSEAARARFPNGLHGEMQ